MPSLEVMRASFTMFDSGDLSVGMNRSAALEISLKLSAQFYSTLLELHWSTCDAPTGAFFITGDSPITSTVFENGKAAFGVGLSLKNFEVSFPISPTVCLYLTRKPRQARWRCRAGFVRELNRRTAYMAERFLYSKYRTRWVGDLVRESGVTRRFPKTDKEWIRQMVREFGPDFAEKLKNSGE